MSSKLDHHIKDEDFLNISDIWPRLATGLVNAICNGPGQYIPVPTLRSKKEAYHPLQVFPDRSSLMTGSVLRLDEVQERVMTRKTAQLNFMRKFHKTLNSALNGIRNQAQHVDTETCKIHLNERIRDKEDGVGFSMEQRIRRWRSPHPNDLDEDNPIKMRQNGRFQLDFGGIYFKSISPTDLLDCRLPPASPILRMGVKKFFVIYETCLVQEIRCTLKCVARSHIHDEDDDGREEQVKVVYVQECPIAFRCVQVSVDGEGVVDDLRYDVSEKDIMSVNNTKSYAILSPQMLIHMKAPKD